MDYTVFRNGERDGWTARAGVYAGATARATCQAIPRLLDEARLFPGARVLDAGCGPGFVAACAQLLGAQAEGIDFSEGMIAEAQARFPDISFAVADVEDIPSKDAAYDAVLSNIVLFHVTDPAKAMAEARRVLKPGGRLVFSQWLGPDQSECYRVLFDVIGKLADMTRADPAPNAYALSDEANVSAMMRHAGFADIKAEVVANVLHAPGPSFFDFFMTFGVRVPLILARQETDVRDRIRAEIDAAMAPYLDGGVYRVQMPSIVFSGVAV